MGGTGACTIYGEEEIDLRYEHHVNYHTGFIQHGVKAIMQAVVEQS